MPPLPALSPADRAELCRRIDFPALLARYGVEVKANGNGYLAAIRPERTPSCHIWGPGVGRDGSKGWTWKDYGTGKGGDALAYLLDIQGLPFLEAAHLLADLAGFQPAGLLPADGPRETPSAPPQGLPEAQPVERPVMDPERQAGAVGVFLRTLLRVHPAAEEEGAAYLKSRGVLPEGWPPVAYHLPRSIVPALIDTLAKSPDLEDLLQAGLMKPPEPPTATTAAKGLRLSWWGDTVLLAHMDATGTTMSFIGRRLDFKPGDTVGKYLQQTYSRGAARLPFGLPTLYRPGWLDWKPAPDRAGEVLVVEGTLDALGAACLGWAALGFSMRPQAHSYLDRAGACPRMLEPHLPALRDLDLVRVMPDNDPGEGGAKGQALAARLVASLRAAGIRATVSTLAELAPDAPSDCKDLADLAKLKGR